MPGFEPATPWPPVLTDSRQDTSAEVYSLEIRRFKFHCIHRRPLVKLSLKLSTLGGRFNGNGVSYVAGRCPMTFPIRCQTRNCCSRLRCVFKIRPFHPMRRGSHLRNACPPAPISCGACTYSIWPRLLRHHWPKCGMLMIKWNG